MMSKRELELYIHIPFCVRKCDYCDFLSSAAPQSCYREYTEKLMEEICYQSVFYKEYVISSIFIGGGTPSVLPFGYLETVLNVVRENYTVRNQIEITVEANPGTLTEEKLATYRRAGVNRISLGLQSADNGELKSLGRIHTFEAFLNSYQMVRQFGFNNINVDLMFSIPGQTMESWKNTLRKVAMLKPEHISAYSLILEEGTAFFERYGESSEELPDEDLDRELYYFTREYLGKMGYERYEISNYAKPGFECRHNIGYWTGTEYLGAGLGATSFIRDVRFHNTREMDEYLALDMREPHSGHIVDEELQLKDKMEEFMIMGLRLTKGVSGSAFIERFGQNMWNVFAHVLPGLVEQGLLEIEAPYIRLTEFGQDVSNLVFERFLGALES